MIKKALLVLVVVLAAAQFIRPPRNLGTVAGPNFIGNQHPIPAATAQVLERACYDCHSNHTEYPWYANVQPVASWLAWHINDGKRHLNFSEFATYSAKRAGKKLEEIGDEVREGGMPLWSYTLAHANARLSDEDKKLLVGWAEAAGKTLPAAPKH
jgi:hypothetical protein